VSLGLVVRDALPSDLDRVVDFNARLAAETEGKALDRAVLERGVRSALADPARLRYWVAAPSEPADVIGQAAVSREWSDWRDGWLWWFQSVYVHPDYRGRSVFRSLYVHIRSVARDAGDVVGLRLYVERGNERALKTYRSLGMTDGGYDVYEEIWPDRFTRPARSC
jgi:GNAT superfamily N-acetyltransferase